MNDKAVVRGEFITFKHIKTRKMFCIEIEFPEEEGASVLEVLGMPIGGISKPVAVCLLDKSKILTKDNPKKVSEKTEGEKLVIRAILLCKDQHFQRFARHNDYEADEEGARYFVLDRCGIKSRSELATNEIAQEHLKAIDRDYKNWLNPVDDIYKDNLERG